MHSLFKLIFGFGIILCLCLTSDIITKSFNKFINNLDDYLFKHSNSLHLTTNDKLVLINIKSYKNKFCLNAMNLFKVNTNTFISCLALIISYSVVLIQTTQTNKHF